MGRGPRSISQAVMPAVPPPRNTASTFLEATGSPTLSPSAASAQLRPQGNCYAAHLPLAPGQEPLDSLRNTERGLGSPPAPTRPLLLLETPSYPPDACCHALQALPCAWPGNQGAEEEMVTFTGNTLQSPRRACQGLWGKLVLPRQPTGAGQGNTQWQKGPRRQRAEKQGCLRNQTGQNARP